MFQQSNCRNSDVAAYLLSFGSMPPPTHRQYAIAGMQSFQLLHPLVSESKYIQSKIDLFFLIGIRH